ncbi:MAG: cytochrome c biogenesis protein CcdA [Magnetococcales bacterium]|nr:cytochrome c biogenesis protein CcdA [Magnetococcales bacterium]
MEVTYAAAFLAGLLSFLSPCVLPLAPAYISYMSGISVEQLRQGDDAHAAWRAGWYSLWFVLGFSLVFIGLGASASYLGQLLLSHMNLLSKVGGAVIVLFGLHYMGVFRLSLLNLEARFNLEKKPTGPLGAFLIGLAFAFGWTPCVGPILAGILAVAGAQENIGQGVTLLAVYSAGLGVPFLVTGVAINLFFGVFERLRVHLHRIEMVSGGLLVVVGVMIFFGDFNRLSSLLLQWFPGLARLG